MNDFILPMVNSNNSMMGNDNQRPSIMNGDDKKVQGRQFYVKFDPTEKKFKIKDLGKGYGAFI